jgi:signal transduction histidine kinase
LAALTTLVTVLALLVSGALVALTTILRQSAVSTGASVESVRLAEEAQIDLLLHERATDPLVKRSLEGDLRQKLSSARQFVTAPDEEHALLVAKSRVDAYVTVSHDAAGRAGERAARQVAAYEAIEALVAINLAQARDAARDAERWDDLGTAVGIAAALLLVTVAGTILAWLRSRAFAPLFDLAAAMDRFGRGDLGARATERGPQELREMCRRFNEMAAAIAVQRRAQMTFLGGVAHDLKNPLSALRMSVALLDPGARSASEDQRRRTLERVDRQITRMDRMLGDFLDIARIEASELELRLDEHDARTMVTHVVELFDGVSPHHRLEVRVPERPLTVRCDQLRIEQVITNLVSNAIKYSPAGGPVEIALEFSDDELELSVTDHGVGISEEDRARVFDPFRRVGLSKDSVPGVGLGLFVVRKLVLAHGGTIDVESERGVGSTFRVKLPLAGKREAELLFRAPNLLASPAS